MTKKKSTLSFISFETFSKKLVEYKWFVIFFIPFLIIQLYHIIQQNWDTVAYIFGGKWFCGNQIYLELIRPPLPSVLNCVFGGTDYSIIFSTAFACIVYFSAIVLIFSRNKKELNSFVFALFSFLFPSILFMSNFGSDLLALSFLLLAFSVTGPVKKGLFFALSSLSRYNYMIMGLVLIWELKKNPKNLLKMLGVFVLVWIPWMIFNYLMTGNPLFSVIETSFLNVAQKGIIAPFFTEQILIILFFAILLFLVKIKYALSFELNQSAIINAIVFVFSGIKETRFINLLVPAIAFNAAKLFGAKYHKSIFLIFVLFIVAILWVYPYPFYAKMDIPSDSFVKDCRTASDKWVFFYNEGIVSECIYDIADLNAFVQNGGSLVVYDYKNFDLNSISGTLVDRGSYVIVHSNSCAPQPKKYISGSLRNYVLRWQKESKMGFYDYSDWVD
jgi:hypothetical protein